MKELMDHFYILSELSTEDSSEELGEESFEGFFTRFFNWDPVRLNSSWKRLSRVDRMYTPSMGSKVPVELLGQMDSFTFDLSNRGRQVVKDLAKEILFDISLILESEEILTKNVMDLQKAIDDGTVRSFSLKKLAIFDRPLLGARLITGKENELDLISQGNAPDVKTTTGSNISFSTSGHMQHTSTSMDYVDRSNDERKLRQAGTYWDNRMTGDVVKSLHLLKTITDRSSLITKSMIRGGDSYTKDIIKQLMVWQEILYEHSYFIVHRTSLFLTRTMY